MESLPGPTHARVAVLLTSARGRGLHELVNRIIENEAETAVLLLSADRVEAGPRWSLVASAGAGLDQSTVQGLSAVLEEVLQTRVPAMRRTVTTDGARDSDVLIVPIEPPQGLPVGILIVMRYRRFQSDDIDCYRLLGLRIADLFSREA